MRKKFNLICLLILVFNLDSVLSQDQVDLKISFEKDGSIYVLDAFSDSQNENILSSENTKRYGYLVWYTLGIPRVILVKNQLFNIGKTGLSFSIESLTSDIQQAFVQEVKRKYNIQLDKSQIRKLLLNKFECLLEINSNDDDGNDEMQKLVFSATDFSRLTYTANLKINKNLNIKKLHESIMEFFKLNSNELHFECTVSDGNTYSKSFELVYSSGQKLDEFRQTNIVDSVNQSFIETGKKLNETHQLISKITSNKIFDQLNELKKSKEINLNNKVENVLEFLNLKVKSINPNEDEFSKTKTSIDLINKKIEAVKNSFNNSLDALKLIKDNNYENNVELLMNFSQDLNDLFNRKIELLNSRIDLVSNNKDTYFSELMEKIELLDAKISKLLKKTN